MSQAMGVERRVPALDGVRGLMTVLVVISHYFGEQAHGLKAAMFGWVAVDMFFVLSGYLVGKLIIEKQHHANFFTVFYVRRVCRTIPIYVACVLMAFAIMAAFGGAHWLDADTQFPLWSYLSFTQNFFMIETNSIGAHWLAPTWTLAIEEQFYLIVPLLFFFVPLMRLRTLLIVAALGAVALRGAIYWGGIAPEMAALVLLPSRADVLICGLLAAIAYKSDMLSRPGMDRALRVAPVVLLICAFALKGAGEAAFQVFSPLLVSAGSAAFLLAIVRGAPEAKRMEHPWMRWCGDNSYAIYLTHLPILGLMHGLILGDRPDVANLAQWAATLAALPATALAAWALTKYVERPLTAYGRSFNWSAENRAVPALRRTAAA